MAITSNNSKGNTNSQEIQLLRAYKDKENVTYIANGIGTDFETGKRLVIISNPFKGTIFIIEKDKFLKDFKLLNKK